MDDVAIKGSEVYDDTVYHVTQQKVSFGQGVNLRLAAGYQINRNFGVELGFHGVIAPRYTYTVGDGPDFAAEQVTQASGPYYLTPAFVFSTGSKWRVFGRAGLGIPLTNTIVQEFSSYDRLFDQSFVGKRTIELSFKPAFEGSIGLSHPLSEQLSIQMELSLISRTAYTKRSEITDYEVNGVELVSFLKPNQKVIEYSEEETIGNQNPSYLPEKRLSYPVPFSSLGFNVGLTYSFN